ncbi:hypothetical protein, partial [Acinetobacter baumannii]|uniref:hypothetical protein n=1 Tax=Acinetobacter baumannii TaxID=470 RepID=UPI0037D12C96
MINNFFITLFYIELDAKSGQKQQDVSDYNNPITAMKRHSERSRGICSNAQQFLRLASLAQ